MKNRNKQTKFPVARIKKIMQKDEEVGKVAQATPVVISKSLELFLAMIIQEANKVTAERGSHKVEAYHLKYAVEHTEVFDFLKEIVQGVPDPSAGGTLDPESADPEGQKKRRSGKGKKADGVDEPAPKRRRKKKGVPAVEEEGDTAAETKSEPETAEDTVMDIPEPDEPRDDVPENDGPSRKSVEMEDAEDDKPFIPR